MKETIIGQNTDNQDTYLPKKRISFDPANLLAMLLGICLLGVASVIAYWIFEQFNQLWTHPESVQLVQFFVEFATKHQGEVLIHQGEKVLALPASASVFLGIIVAVVVLSLAVKVCFELLKHGLHLFFPDFYREVTKPL